MTIAKQQITGAVRTALMYRARFAYPLEACGFIMNSADPGEQFVFEVPNISTKPRHSWTMDPSYQLLAMREEDQVLGVWHTHPEGPEGPSDIDRNYMLPGLRFFVATRNGVYEYEMGQG